MNHVSVETLVGGAEYGRYLPRNDDDLSVMSDLVTHGITGFWQVTRFTAEGPQLLALYGGPGAETKARESSFHQHMGASVLPAYGIETYQQATRAACRELANARGSSLHNYGRVWNQAEVLKQKRYRKTGPFYAAVAGLVEERPGITILEVIRELDHHHVDDKQARRALRQTLLVGGGIPGVSPRWNQDGSQCWLYPRGYIPPPSTVGPVTAATATEPGADDETENSRNEDSDGECAHGPASTQG